MPKFSSSYRQQCWGKRKHGTREQANTARSAMVRRIPDAELRFVPYQCSHCHMFHLGSRPEADFLKRKRRSERRNRDQTDPT